MLLRTLATAVAAGRLAYGVGLAAAPREVGSWWIGSEARHGATQMVLRGFAVRDVVLGAGALRALTAADAGPVTWWAAAQGISDAADLVGAIVAGRALPAPIRTAVIATAAGAAAVNLAVVLRGRELTRR